MTEKKTLPQEVPQEAWRFLRMAQLDCDINKMIHPQTSGRIVFEEVKTKPATAKKG